MKTIPTSLPGHLIDWYWREVEAELVRTHHLSPAAARGGIDKYRRVLARDGVGDMIYHADVKETARGIKVGGYAD